MYIIIPAHSGISISIGERGTGNIECLRVGESGQTGSGRQMPWGIGTGRISEDQDSDRQIHGVYGRPGRIAPAYSP